LGPWICLPKGIISLCAVVAGFLIRNPFNGLDFGFWAVPAVLVLAAAGFLNGLLNTKVRMPSIISTLGMWWVAQGVAVILGRGNAVKMLDPRFQLITNGELAGVPNTMLLATLLCALLLVLERSTRLGKFLYAIGGDEALARR
jgi:ribose/xylose/arabinose/galactoside ABC-type transport system permease subunit